MPFHIYRASAGAGKTFTLVKEYLRLALASDDASAYAHIMAITFTNKAAGEMKERIFNMLEKFSRGEVDEPMAAKLRKEIGIDGNELASRSKACLKHMLHNYGLIAVSTIDKFTLRVLKGFAVELGLPSMFEVSLDQDELKVRIADDVMAQVGSDKELTDALVDLVEQRTDQEKAWTLDGELQKLAGTIFSEDGRLNMRRLEGIDLNDFKALRIKLQAFNSQFKFDLMAIGKEAADLIERNGIDAGSMAYTGTGIHQYFQYLKTFRDDKLIPNSHVNKTLETDKWISGKCQPDQHQAIDSIKDQLRGFVNQATAILDDRFETFSVYRIVLASLHGMSLLAEMKACLDVIQQEEDIVSISEFNHLLNKEVMDQPAPFIYERLGHRYRHFLVDEFQDTSVLQWMNLLPLIDESLGTAGFSMVVGDGKQSIYRWRGGKVEQFTHLPKIYREDIGELSVSEKALLDQREENLVSSSQKFPLDQNWRSAPTIVNFNNGLFRSIAENSSEEIKLVYAELEQHPTRNDQTGYVQLAWQDGDNKDEKSFAHAEQLVDWVQQCLDDKYHPCDIAILCRKNDEVRFSAAILMAEGFKVVSNEALLVNSHPAVRLAVDLIKWKINPQDRIICGAILRNIHLLSGSDLALSKFLEPLKTGHVAAVRSAVQIHFPSMDLSHALTQPLYQMFGGLISLINEQTTPPLRGTPPFQEGSLWAKASPSDRDGRRPEASISQHSNDARIAAFMEFVAAQSTKDGIDVQTFLEVWEEKSAKLAISTEEDPEAIKILTVHSAKGLQFPVVIHPYVDYGSRPADSVIWAKTDRKDLQPLSVIRTNATSALKETDMQPDLEREVDRSEMDVINTLYVALTRPKDRLYVSVSMNGRSLSGAPKFLVDRLAELGHDLQEDGLFADGEEVDNTGKGKSESGGRSIQAPFTFHTEGIAQVRKVSRSKFEEQADRLKSLEHGKMVHALLESVVSVDDLAELEHSELVRSMARDEKEAVLEAIKKVTRHETIGRWFAPNLEVLNERDLMDSDGKTHRPDRMVRGPESTAILEYKTGNRAEAHEEQLGRYMTLMESIDNRPCEGYLVYLPDVEVVRI